MSNSTDGAPVLHEELHYLGIGRHRGTLATRIAAVAAISVILAGGIALAVAIPLVQNEAQVQAREELARQADVLVDVLRDNGQNPSRPGDRGAQIGHHVVVIPVNSASTPIGPISESDIRTILNGDGLSAVREIGGGSFFLEGRWISDGRGFIMVERDTIAKGPINTLLIRMAVALGIGLLIAIAVALYVAQRTAKPLREAAEAAQQLASGDRDVDVTVGGAAEVAAIGSALNRLADNLATSEDRQREFLMSVSHELRTPMTSIKGYAEALADGVIERSEVESTGALLVGETARLDRLISDLLDLARAGAVDFRLSPTEVNLAAIARAASEAWRIRCEREGMVFEADIEMDQADSYVDPTRVRQIIDNLIENAVRVTPAGGTIKLSVFAGAGFNAIVIDDSGPGLSDDDLEVAFQPAVLHSRYRGLRSVGTGLGLALVGRLAERMGGSATAGHSQLGGAQFVVEFPAADAEELHD